VLLAGAREEHSHLVQYLVVAAILLSGAALYVARRPRP
jgi:hypothetical protein